MVRMFKERPLAEGIEALKEISIFCDGMKVIVHSYETNAITQEEAERQADELEKMVDEKLTEIEKRADKMMENNK